MSDQMLKLYLFTNGTPQSLPAVRQGIWLAKSLRLEVLLVGVLDGSKSESALAALLTEFADLFREQGIPSEITRVKKPAVRAITEFAAGDQHLIIFGPLGRPSLLRWLRGRFFRDIIRRVHSPVLYVRREHYRLDKILLCVGGLGHARGIAATVQQLARFSGAAVTVLHVVEPLVYEYPIAEELARHWENLLESDTPQAQNLRSILAEFEAAGLTANWKVRHGHTVHEIIDEAASGAYDLIGLGSPHSSAALRRLFTPNVTAEVAEALTIPVLTAGEPA